MKPSLGPLKEKDHHIISCLNCAFGAYFLSAVTHASQSARRNITRSEIENLEKCSKLIGCSAACVQFISFAKIKYFFFFFTELSGSSS